MNQAYIDNSISLRFLNRIWRGSLLVTFVRGIRSVAARVTAGSRVLGFFRVRDYLRQERESLLSLVFGSWVLQELDRAGKRLCVSAGRKSAAAIENLHRSRAAKFWYSLGESSSGRSAIVFFALFLGAYLSMRVLLLALVPSADRITPLSAGIIIAGVGGVLLARINAKRDGKGALGRMFSGLRRMLDIIRSVSRYGFARLKRALAGSRIPPVEGGPDS